MDYTINIFSLIIIILLLTLFIWNFYTNKKNLKFIQENFKLNSDKLDITKVELQNYFASNQQSIQKLDTNVQNLQQNFDKELNKILHEIKSPLNLD